MGAIAGVIFFIILFVSGIVGIIISIAGLIISKVMRKSGNRFAKAVKVISIIWMIGSIILTAIPTSFFGFIFYINSKLPENYVETDILVEGNIYQDDHFTADGKVYRLLDFEANSDGCKDKATPVFSYKPMGILMRSQWTNFYRIETDQDFDLIWNGDCALYCTDDDREEIIEYYGTCGYQWTYCDPMDLATEDEPTTYHLPEDAIDGMKEYIKLDISKLAKEEFNESEIDELRVGVLHIDAFSDDGVCSRFFNIYVMKDGVYEYLETTFGDEYGDDKVIAVRLPDDIGIPLSKLVGQ